VLTVSSLSFSRVLQRPSDETLSTCVSLGLKLLNVLRGLAAELYYSPRAELNGAKACRVRTHGIPEDRLDKFFNACISLYQRPAASSIAKAIDVPNLHRTRELWDVCGRYLGHVRFFIDLELESAHQPMKQAIIKATATTKLAKR